jgi:hypothetical protein
MRKESSGGTHRESKSSAIEEVIIASSYDHDWQEIVKSISALSSLLSWILPCMSLCPPLAHFEMKERSIKQDHRASHISTVARWDGAADLVRELCGPSFDPSQKQHHTDLPPERGVGREAGSTSTRPI